MKFRAWISALALAAMASCLGCTTSSSSTPSSNGSLFVTTQGDQMISSYQVDLSNGGLTASGASVATGVAPNSIVLAPSGNALFVANSSDDTISSFTVNSDGTLAAGSSIPTGVTPRAMGIDSAVPGYKIRTMALPYGLWPKNRPLAWQGSWTDPKTKQTHPYKFEAVLEVAGGPARSPYDPQFNPHSINRIEAIGDDIPKQLDKLAKSNTRFVVGGSK